MALLLKLTSFAQIMPYPHMKIRYTVNSTSESCEESIQSNAADVDPPLLLAFPLDDGAVEVLFVLPAERVCEVLELDTVREEWDEVDGVP